MNAFVGRWMVIVLCSLFLMVSPSSQEIAPGPLSDKEFIGLAQGFGTATIPLQVVSSRLPNRQRWSDFIIEHAGQIEAHIDPRSGTPAGILCSVPLIPGSGAGNGLTLRDLETTLQRTVGAVTADVVADVVRRYFVQHREVMAIAVDQMGPIQATAVTDSLWQISIPQVVQGVPVRHGRLVATVNHGNLTLLGTELWGNVTVGTVASISAVQALENGFAYAQGRLPDDLVKRDPALELISFAPAGRSASYEPGGPIGGGYAHRLVWTFAFERAKEIGLWEVLVDAQSGVVLALRDSMSYAKRRIKGGVYPLTNTGSCPSADRCGTMMADYPMPWADYATAVCDGSPTSCSRNADCGPGDVCNFFFSNSGGVFDSSANLKTQLKGQFVTIVPRCGAMPSTLVSGDIDLGGSDGNHDCVTGQGGNSPAARAAFYEVAKITEMARGWVPGNPWLGGAGSSCARTPPKVTVNKTGTGTKHCWAGYTPESAPSNITFHNSIDCSDQGQCDSGGAGQECETFTGDGAITHVGSQCRNLGELATVIAHEWGHALDDNDLSCSGNNRSNTSEAYADIAAMYRHQVSCHGYGMHTTTTQCTNICEPRP